MKRSEKAAEVVGWPQRQFKGHPMITAIMLLVLRHLEAAKAQEWPCVELDDHVHRTTLQALLDRDWIFEVRANGTFRYGLTARGERYLRLYESPYHSQRRDGLCPTCGRRPKHVLQTGTRTGYCYECLRAYQKANRALGRPLVNPDRLCSSCRQRPVHVCASGRVRTYCKECLRERQRQAKRRRQQRWRARIEAGDVPLCYKCKAAPVYYTENSIYDMCYACYWEYQKAYRRRRSMVAAREGGVR